MGKSARIISRLMMVTIVLWGLLGQPRETTSAAGTMITMPGTFVALTCQDTPLSIRVENVADLTAYHLEIDFTPGDVVVTMVENGGFLAPGIYEPTNGYDNTAGTVVFGMARRDYTTQPVSGSGVLINIWVKAVVGHEGGAVNFTVRPYTGGPNDTGGTGSALVGWPDAMPIPYTITNGTVYTQSCPSTDIQLSNTLIDENLPVGTAVGTLTTSDLDENAVFTYSFADDATYPDNAIFTIDGDILRTAAVFDYETLSSYHINIRSESADNSKIKDFNITVTDVNDPPVLGAIGPQSVNEHALLTFTATATDEDTLPAPDTKTFSLAAIPPGAVPAGAGIGGSSGNFSWTPAEDQGPGSYTFNVCVSDGAASDCEPITVTVYEVNAAPSGTDKTVTILEDGSYVFGTSDFGFSDASDIPANTLSGVFISTLPSDGSLKLNGTVMTSAGTLVSEADIGGGKLTYEPAANANHTPYASFTFQVKDDGGTNLGGVDTDPTAKTFTINVTSVNDAPAGMDKTITLVEDDPGYPLQVTDFGFTDPNDDPGNAFAAVKITTLPAAGSLKFNDVVITAGTEIQVGDLANLKFIPDANGNGNPYATFTFQVRDDGGIVNEGANLDPTPNTITFVVTAVNDAPVGEPDTYIVNNTMDIDTDDNPYNGKEAARLIVPAPGVMSNDYDVDGDTLTVIEKSYIGPGKLELNPDGSFTYQSQTGVTNYLDSFVYTLSDGHGGTTDVTVNLTIDRLGPPVTLEWLSPDVVDAQNITWYDDPLLLKVSTTALTDVVRVQFRWWDTRILGSEHWVIVYDQPPVPGQLEYSYTLDMTTLPYLSDVQVYAYFLDASGSATRTRFVINHKARVFLPLIKR